MNNKTNSSCSSVAANEDIEDATVRIIAIEKELHARRDYEQQKPPEYAELRRRYHDLKLDHEHQLSVMNEQRQTLDKEHALQLSATNSKLVEQQTAAQVLQLKLDQRETEFHQLQERFRKLADECCAAKLNNEELIARQKAQEQNQLATNRRMMEIKAKCRVMEETVSQISCVQSDTATRVNEYTEKLLATEKQLKYQRQIEETLLNEKIRLETDNFVLLAKCELLTNRLEALSSDSIARRDTNTSKAESGSPDGPQQRWTRSLVLEKCLEIQNNRIDIISTQLERVLEVLLNAEERLTTSEKELIDEMKVIIAEADKDGFTAEYRRRKALNGKKSNNEDVLPQNYPTKTCDEPDKSTAQVPVVEE